MSTPSLNKKALIEAIIELNSMSPCDGVIMTKAGEIRTGNADDAELLCMLIEAPTLARQLTADGLSSYTGKELRQWAEAYDTAPLEARLNQLN